jgi:hypothetical protein
LRMRLEDQQGHRERVVMDCRNQQLSPRGGLVDRIPATALGKRACRLGGRSRLRRYGHHPCFSPISCLNTIPAFVPTEALP